MSKRIVEIQADKKRHLKFGSKALIELEQSLGRSLMEIDDGLAFQDLVKMFYVGIKWEDKELTFDTACDIFDDVIDENGMEYLSEKIQKAIQGAMGSTPSPKNK